MWITGFVPATGSPAVVASSLKVIYNNAILNILSYDAASGMIIASYVSKVAGSYKPIVDQVGYGIALSTGVALSTVVPEISSLSKSSIYSFGGSSLTVNGSYFPADKTDLTVAVGGVSATITSVSNTSITILTPVLASTGSKDVVVTYKTLSSTASSITVDNTNAMTISSLSSTLISPVAKTPITVTGTNFGTDKSKLTAFLDEMNGSVVLTYAKYNVNVVQVTDSTVKVLLGGGTAGTYRLRVVKIGAGSNDPNTTNDRLEYNTYVKTLSRTTSSKYGGGSLTITGTNFAAASSDNQILIVYSPINAEFCVITAASTTSLTCTLPDMSTHMTAATVTFSIEIWGLLIVQAKVSPDAAGLNMSIIYREDLAPVVTGVSATSVNSGTVFSLTGTSLPTTIADIAVFAVGYEAKLATIATSTGSSISSTVPLLEAGSYKFVVRTADGNSAPQAVTIVADVYGYTGYTSATTAGSEVIFNFSGGSDTYDPVFMFGTVVASVISWVPSTGKATVRLPAVAAGSTKLYLQKSAVVALNADGTFPWKTHGLSFTVTAATWTVTSTSVSG